MWNIPKTGNDNYWTYGYIPKRKTINRGEYDNSLVLRFLAIKIYITAMDGEVRNFQKETQTTFGKSCREDPTIFHVSVRK